MTSLRRFIDYGPSSRFHDSPPYHFLKGESGRPLSGNARSEAPYAVQKARRGSGGPASVPATVETSRTNLILRRLDSAVDEEVLTSVFSLFGNIASRAVMRNIHTGESLGTAFVRFETHEQAKAALQFFHDFERAVGAPGKRGSIAATASVAESELQAMGVLARMRQRGDPTIVAISTTLEATAGFNESHFRDTCVQWARKQHDNTPDSSLRYCIRKLFIRNIPCTITRDTLQSYFSFFGRVQSVSIHKDTLAAAAVSVPTSATADRQPPELGATSSSGESDRASVMATPGPAVTERRIAFVTYDEDGAAEKAANAVHNTKPFPGCKGIPLMVKLAEDTSTTSAAPHIGAHGNVSSAPRGGSSGMDLSGDRRSTAAAVPRSSDAAAGYRAGCTYLPSGCGPDFSLAPSITTPLSASCNSHAANGVDSCSVMPIHYTATSSSTTVNTGAGFYGEKNVSTLSLYNDGSSSGRDSASLELSHRSAANGTTGVTSYVSAPSMELRSPTRSLPAPRSGRPARIVLPDPFCMVSDPLTPAGIDGDSGSWLMAVKPMPTTPVAGSARSHSGRGLCYHHNPYSLTSPRVYINSPVSGFR